MRDSVQVISDVSELISGGSDRPLNLNPILDAAVSGLGAAKAFLFLNTPGDEKMARAASSGLSVAEFRRLDLVAEAPIFKEITAPEKFDKLSEDEAVGFLSEKERGSLLAAPVAIAKKSFGVLGFVFDTDGDLRNLLQPIFVISSMIAQSIRIERSVHGERQRLTSSPGAKRKARLFTHRRDIESDETRL